MGAVQYVLLSVHDSRKGDSNPFYLLFRNSVPGYELPEKFPNLTEIRFLITKVLTDTLMLQRFPAKVCIDKPYMILCDIHPDGISDIPDAGDCLRLPSSGGFKLSHFFHDPGAF